MTNINPVQVEAVVQGAESELSKTQKFAYLIDWNHDGTPEPVVMYMESHTDQPRQWDKSLPANYNNYVMFLGVNSPQEAAKINTETGKPEGQWKFLDWNPYDAKEIAADAEPGSKPVVYARDMFMGKGKDDRIPNHIEFHADGTWDYISDTVITAKQADLEQTDPAALEFLQADTRADEIAYGEIVLGGKTLAVRREIHHFKPIPAKIDGL